jgi:hypothetical protein
MDLQEWITAHNGNRTPPAEFEHYVFNNADGSKEDCSEEEAIKQTAIVNGGDAMLKQYSAVLMWNSVYVINELTFPLIGNLNETQDVNCYPTPIIELPLNLDAHKAPQDVLDTASLRNSTVNNIRGNPDRVFDIRWDLGGYSELTGSDVVPLDPVGWSAGMEEYMMFYFYVKIKLNTYKLPFNTKVNRTLYFQGVEETSEIVVPGTTFSIPVTFTISVGMNESATVMMMMCIPATRLDGKRMKIGVYPELSKTDPMYYEPTDNIEIVEYIGGTPVVDCDYSETTYSNYCDDGTIRQLKRIVEYKGNEDDTVCIVDTDLTYEEISPNTWDLASGTYIIAEATGGDVVKDYYSEGVKKWRKLLSGTYEC